MSLIKAQETFEKIEHKAHFLAGIGNLAAFLLAIVGFLYGLAKGVEKYLPNYAQLAESHRWVLVTLFAWFVATLVLLYLSFVSKDLKNALHRLGLICAENMKANDYSFAQRRKIIKNYKKDFLSSQKICILGATGYHTFSKIKDDVDDNVDNSALLRPILDEIKNDRSKCSSVSIDVLLLHPESKYVSERIDGLQNPVTDLDKYKEEILYSISECKKLKSVIPNLRCFLYDRPLIWKLIITDSLAWQQFYEKGTHAEHSRLNIFSNVATGGNALYPPFLKLFELLRDTAALEVDLSVNAALPILAK